MQGGPVENSEAKWKLCSGKLLSKVPCVSGALRPKQKKKKKRLCLFERNLVPSQ